MARASSRKDSGPHDKPEALDDMDWELLAYLEKLHGDFNVAGDEYRKFRHIAQYGKRNICKRCGGTGNEMMWHYRSCTDCLGKGVKLGASKKQQSLASERLAMRKLAKFDIN